MSGLGATHMKTKDGTDVKRFRLTETIYMNLKASLYIIYKNNCFEALAEETSERSSLLEYK